MIMNPLDTTARFEGLPYTLLSLLTMLLSLISISKDESKLIRTLCDKFNEPEILKHRDDFGWTCLHYFAHLGKPNLVNLFFSHNQAWLVAYQRDTNGMTALHIAAREGQVKVLMALIENCPDVCESLDNRHRTALHVATECRKENVINILMKAKAFGNLLNERDIDGNTALHISASCGHYQIAELLTSDKRVDVGAVNNAGMTALDVILSDTHHDKFTKILIIVGLKKRGSQPSLVSAVIRAEKSIPNHQTPGPSISSSSTTTTTEEVKKREGAERVKNTAQINLIVATIISSITFSAAISMPGGYGSSDCMACLRRRASFTIFLIFDSVAFGSSTSSMLIHFIVGFMSGNDYSGYPVECISVLSAISICSAALAFFFGTNAVLWKNSSDSSFPGYIMAISFLSPLFYTWARFGGTGLFKLYFSKIHE